MPKTYTPRQRTMLMMFAEKIKALDTPFAVDTLKAYSMSGEDILWLADEVHFIIDAYLHTEA